MFFLTNQSFKNKKAIIRVDLNVPLDSSLKVTDATRIIACRETIDYVINKGGACVLMAHLGRPKGKDKTLSLSNILIDVSQGLQRKIKFVNDCIGDSVEKAVSELKPGEVLLLENLRFYKEESAGEEAFAKQLAKLGDVYINDAFGTCHREHASTFTVAKFFPDKKYAGKLLEKELNVLSRILENGQTPILAILGGAKVSSKLKSINNLIERVDRLIIAGGMAFTFIKANGGEIGASPYESSLIEEARSILNKANQLKKEVFLKKYQWLFVLQD